MWVTACEPESRAIREKKKKTILIFYYFWYCMRCAWSGRCSPVPAVCPFSSHKNQKKLYLIIFFFHKHMKNTVGSVGSRGILSCHYSSVESQNVYFELALDTFTQKFIMGLLCYPFKRSERQ